jgi:hypothetical protein
VTVNAYSAQRWLDKGDIWTVKTEQYVPLNAPLHSPAALHVFLSHLAPASGIAVAPPPIPPRVLGHRHKWRELREGEPLFALGEVSLARADSVAGSEGQSESDAHALTFSLELSDGRPVMLRSGTRQSYLDSLTSDARDARRVGYFFGGVSLLSALHCIAKGFGQQGR